MPVKKGKNQVMSKENKKSKILMMLEKKLHDSFLSGVQKGLDRLKSEMNILKGIENNYACKL